ncbi:MAG: glycogen synthase [Geodermatophilaceae bacterium]|nr:glycogen synthase [Geodermatophilaceae bacterium]MDQ3463625.1 glycogen synthase [Actinomycetota bacterium]
MRVGLLTKEFPPDVYGGAGVHVEFLARELRSLVDVDVHCFGAPREGATAHEVSADLVGTNPALQTIGVDLSMVNSVNGCDLLHSHTWYANLAGHLGALLYGVPHVLTAHSLEPRRPWKAEQLGGGYALSSWAERTAYEAAHGVIAVSEGMRRDILDCYPFLDAARVHVVRNGIDTTDYWPDPDTGLLDRLGIDPDRPYVLFVGRITRQKGVPHLIRAAASVDPDAQIVLCAGAPDTPQLGAEVLALVEELSERRSGVHWIPDMQPREDVRRLLSHATVFCCPSVYEPLGIVNLEAMACGTAVVASDVGGIPEVVDDGTTGLLVHYDEQDPAGFEAALAGALNRVLADRPMAESMGAAGRARADGEFGWPAVATRTVEVYRALLA